MTPRQLFALHVLLFSTFPVVAATRRSALAVKLLYAHVAVILMLGGFLGGLYSFPLTARVTLSAGAVAYGSLMFTAIVLLFISRDLQIIRDLVKLVVAVNAFKFAFFHLASRSLEADGGVNPFDTAPEVFTTSIRVVVIGGFLIITELVLLVVAFERIKARRAGAVVNTTWFVVAFVAALGLDGLAFPLLNAPSDAELGHLLRSGLESKLLLAAAYSGPLVAYLVLFRSSVRLFEAQPLRVRSLLRPPDPDLLREIERQQEVLQYQASHDVMTGLANRTMLLQRVEAALAHRRADADHPVAVLFVDLDDLKLVNDRHGHDAGNAVLVAVAARLRACLREGDLAARLGGDEFAVLLERFDDAEAAVEVSERVLATIREPLVLEYGVVAIHASVGVALADDDEEADGGAEALVRNADLAMYRAKALGKDRVELYAPGLHLAARANAELVEEIRRGIEDREFVAHYQPVVDLATGRVVGVEALVRWHHPRRGVLAPAHFIAVAEQGQAIVDLGGQVLEQVCHDAVGWGAHHDPSFRVSVNVSTRQLRDPAIVEQVTDALHRSGLGADLLTLEITESTLISDVAGSVATLDRLRALGVRVSIDDFGTGFSSLAYLRQLPLDVLKIDRSFVEPLGTESGPAGEPLVEAIIGLGDLFGLTVVAEGIETEQQRAALLALGCTLGQGFLFSPAVPASEITALVRRADGHDPTAADPAPAGPDSRHGS